MREPSSGDRCFLQGFGPLEQHRSVGGSRQSQQKGPSKGKAQKQAVSASFRLFYMTKTKMFYSQAVFWVRPMQVSTRDFSLSPASPDHCHPHASGAHGLGSSQALRLLLLLSRGWKIPFSRKKPSHLLLPESETALETLSCN